MRTTVTTLTSRAEPYWEYIIPRYENNEENAEATQLIDILQEIDHPSLEGETEALSHDEIVSRLMRSSKTEYVTVDKTHAQELIDHRKNAIETYGENNFNNDEYQQPIIDMLESGKLFTIIPKREAIMHLVDTN